MKRPEGVDESEGAELPQPRGVLGGVQVAEEEPRDRCRPPGECHREAACLARTAIDVRGAGLQRTAGCRERGAEENALVEIVAALERDRLRPAEREPAEHGRPLLDAEDGSDPLEAESRRGPRVM